MVTTEMYASKGQPNHVSPKTAMTKGITNAGAVEVMGIEEGEAPKSHYSKASVVLMVIFSGLAIGSDG